MGSWLPYLAAVPGTASAISYAEWRAVHFSAGELGNASVSGDLADPEGNGFGNLLEFAFALDP